MRFLPPQNAALRVTCRFLVMTIAIALSWVNCPNTAHAAGPKWLGGIFGSKKAASQPNTVTVPNLTSSVDAQAIGRAATTAQVQIARERAALEAQRVQEAARAIPPSTFSQPAPIRNQTNDQYLAGLLQKAQATPKAKGQFAGMFPELRADYRRMKQPSRTATNMNGLASWLSQGTAAITQRNPVVDAPKTEQIAGKTIPTVANQEGAVQVQHVGDLTAPAASVANANEWTQTSSSQSPADAAVAEALNGVQTQFADPEPVVPEEYRNMKLPGLPDGAKIMSIQDRVITPAAVPPGGELEPSGISMGSSGVSAGPTSPTIGSSTFAPQTHSNSGLSQADIDQLVPQVIGPDYRPQSVVNSNPISQQTLAPPSAAGFSSTSPASQPITANRMMTHTIRPSAPHGTMMMDSTTTSAPSIPTSDYVSPNGFSGMQSTVSVPTPAAAPQVITTQLPSGITMNIPADGRTAVHLTPEQIKSLPVGTKLIPANAAALQALTGKTAPKMAARTANTIHPNATMPQRQSLSAAKLATERGKLEAAQRALAAIELKTAQAETELKAAQAQAQLNATRMQTAQLLQSTSQPSGVRQTQAIQIPAERRLDGAATATRTNHSESSVVKVRLNRAFELSQTNPAAAEQEFIEVLRFIATAHDQAEGLNVYAAALDRGLLTLREAEQVQNVLKERGEDAALNLAHSMRSEVSRSFSNGKIATTDLMECYYLYARHSLMIAIGEQPLGSQALYGWGQLCSARGQQDGYDETVERGKAVSLLTAALDADKNNWRVHNELGVIHARNGEYVKSEKALRRSLAIEPRPETYSNIAMVLEQQGKSDRATDARDQASQVYTSTETPGTSVPQVSQATSAQVAAEQPVKSSRKEKVQAFVDRLMGTDSSQPPKGFEDDGIPITQ